MVVFLNAKQVGFFCPNFAFPPIKARNMSHSFYTFHAFRCNEETNYDKKWKPNVDGAGYNRLLSF